MSPYTLRRLSPADRGIVVALLEREWGGVDVMALSLGGLVDASDLPGWLAVADDGEVAGLLTYRTGVDVIDIVTINAFAGGGVGAALVAALVEEVRDTARRLRVTTTNDNTRALRFYQRAGFRLTALRAGAVEESRKTKPGIPELGHDDIPIRDELELEMKLSR
ncbi:MAG TPA: GNAT family N-acetyltransferase [Nocardioidaceae bacterium]|nr:GNAT family N-acetyltransferase [Nocardioidaceae bacterium]